VRVSRALILLLAAACERDRTPEPKPPPRDAAVPASCELADDRIELGRHLELRFHGTAFASVGGRVQHVEVHFSEHGATARSTNDQATLWGDVEPGTIEVHPRKVELVGGWLAIHAATLASTRDPAELVIHPSSLVVFDYPASFHVRCKELTLAEAPVTQRPGKDGVLRRGKTSPIAHEPKGPAFAKLVTPPGRRNADIQEIPYTVRVQAERDGWVQVIIESSDADVHGWVPSDAIGPDELTMAGLSGLDAPSSKPKLQSCPNAMPIYVRDRDTIDRVGTTTPGAKLPVVSTTADELVLDLGAEPDPMFTLVKPEPHLQPFVRRADAAGCKRVEPDQ
jgi:hypothetical protein